MNKLLLSTAGDRQRKLQVVKMQRKMIVGSPAPVNTATVQLIHLWLRGNIMEEGGEKIIRGRPGHLL